MYERKRNVRLKGDIFYTSFMNFDLGAWKFLTDKYRYYYGIENFLDDELFNSFQEILSRLENENLISVNEIDILNNISFLYFDAFLEWLDSSDNVKIIIE